MAPSLFTPLNIGPCRLGQRMVMAPLTRTRAERSGNVLRALKVEYYRQRASPGEVIIAEVSQVSPQERARRASVRRSRSQAGVQ